jgi:cell division protein FtsI/penicillin-binding protein 2
LLGVAIVATTVVAVAGGAYVLLRTKGGPAQTARAFLAGWQRGDLAAMHLAMDTLPPDVDRQYQALHDGLGVERVQASLTHVTKKGGRATATFAAALTMPMGTWRYQGVLRLRTVKRQWKVTWSPEAIHPDLHAGQHLATGYRWPRRGSVLAADGSRLDGAPTAAQRLIGYVGPATVRQARHLGTPHRTGDVVGQAGIQQRFDKRLAGTPATTISLADASGHPLRTVGGFAGRPGRDVRTTLDRRIERAAMAAVAGEAKPTSLVAIRPATGQVLAVVNHPDGYDRAMQGIYPPGSTFKVITAYALLQSGLSPSATVNCPKVANVGGQVIHNSEGENLGDITFKDAFAQSCNTAFSLQTQKRLSPAKLLSAASAFGFNQKFDPGVPARAGTIPTPTSDAEMALAGFGQARDLSNALTMAAVAGGVASGTWRPPVFVADPPVRQRLRPNRLDPAAVRVLTDMMRAVVTSGTAAPAHLPPGTAGKTGTAEYGSGEKPPAHSWFIGFRGDVAFAIVVEGGGCGAKVAAPIAGRFLRGL